MTSVIVIGAGGHAKVLIDTLQMDPHIKLLGILEIDPACYGKEILGVRVLGGEELIKKYSPGAIQLVNGLGSVGVPWHRAAVFKRFKALGHQFLSVIHPSVYVASSVTLGEGVQLMAGSIIQADSVIGANVIVNTKVVVEHDCQIGHHVHLGPGAILSGQVVVGDTSHVGCGAVIIQGTTVGRESLVGAGAVVVRHVQAAAKAIGVPARCTKLSKEERTIEELE